MKKIWKQIAFLIIGTGLVVLWGTAFSAPDNKLGPEGDLWPKIDLVPVITGLESPVYLTHAGDGSGRLFVLEQAGVVRIWDGAALLASPFLDISNRVSCCLGEQGMFGLAFPPNYTNKDYFYVSYTNLAEDLVIERYEVTGNPNIADPNSGEIILIVEQPHLWHNGGHITFGPNDGYLYIGTGDGGGFGDPWDNSQNPDTLLGKILRIDPESVSAGYAIPPTNPFVGVEGYREEIWALGVRNPWRFSIDPVTGDLYIGDVGQNLYEEIDFQPGTSEGGENYGWNIMEGAHCYDSTVCDQAGLVLPVTEYTHVEGCAVVGGSVYNGQTHPEMRETYYFSDFCSGSLWGLRYNNGAWDTSLLFSAPINPVGIGESENGTLYLISHTGNTGVYEIIHDPSPDISTSFKRSSQETGDIGDIFTYEVVVRNTGWEPIEETVFVTDTLPLGLDYLSESLTASSGVTSIEGNDIKWRGSIDGLTDITISYQVRANGEVMGEIENTAIVEAGVYGHKNLKNTVVIGPDMLYMPLMNQNWADSYSYFGVHANRYGQNPVIEKIVGAHMNWVRIAPFEWDAIEPVRTNPPTYDWSMVNEQALLAISESGANLISVVLKAPDWALKYPGISCGPLKPTRYDEYAEFLAALITRYGQPPYNIKLLEIGNEPDVDHNLAPADFGFGCWGEANDAFFGGEAYGNMLQEIYPAVKAADPDAQVLVGGLLLDCPPENGPQCLPGMFLDGILESGAGGSFDGVAFHAYDFYGLDLGLYGNSNWDSFSFTTGPVLTAKIEFLRDRLEAYGHGDKYLIGTESALLCGSDTGGDPECLTETALDSQAIYLAHAYTAGLANDLTVNIWYSLNQKWRNVNLLTIDNEPKPAYDALKFIRSRLGDIIYKGKITSQDVGTQGISGYKFDREGRKIWVIWTNDETYTNISLPSAPLVIFDLYGNLLPSTQMVGVNVFPLIIEFSPEP